MLYIFDLIFIVFFISFSIALSFYKVGKEYVESYHLHAELFNFVQKYIPPPMGKYNNNNVPDLRFNRILADSIATEMLSHVGNFYLIKEDQKYQLYFCGQDSSIAFWFVYNKKEQKVESVKPDCFEESIDELYKKEKFNAALAVLKIIVKPCFSKSKRYSQKNIEAIYISTYKSDPPQWLLDSLQIDVPYKLLPRSQMITDRHMDRSNWKNRPKYFINEFEVTSRSTALIQFTGNHYRSEIYEILKDNDKWKLGMSVGGGYSWVDMYKKQENITDHFRKEKVNKPETRK